MRSNSVWFRVFHNSWLVRKRGCLKKAASFLLDISITVNFVFYIKFPLTKV